MTKKLKLLSSIIQSLRQCIDRHCRANAVPTKSILPNWAAPLVMPTPISGPPQVTKLHFLAQYEAVTAYTQMRDERLQHNGNRLKKGSLVRLKYVEDSFEKVKKVSRNSAGVRVEGDVIKNQFQVTVLICCYPI